MRCPWSEQTESMRQYHDTVWGVPEYDDQKLFRKLMLDINQAGLSWQTILNKSEAFDEAYDRFDIKKVANYGETKISELMENKGIIRNRDLKKRGFKFIGSTTIYAFLEAVGIINDHLDSCFRKEEVVRIGRKGE